MQKYFPFIVFDVDFICVMGLFKMVANDLWINTLSSGNTPMSKSKKKFVRPRDRTPKPVLVWLCDP
jgi:hypothetical protein